MAEQHVKTFKALGLDDATIDSIEKMEADKVKDWDPSEIQTKVKDGYKTQLMNDDEFLKAIPEERFPADLKKKIETGQATRFQNEMKEVAMKKLGLEDKDFEDLKPGQKDSVIKAMVEHIATKHLAKKGNVEGLQKMQEDLRKMTEDLEKKDSDWQAKLDTELEKVNGASSSRLVKAVTRAEIATLDDVDVTVPASYITDQLLARLQAKYTIVLDDNDEPQLRQKGNKELKVMDGSKEVTFRDALKAQIIADKLGTERKEEGGGGGTGGKKRVVVGGEHEEEVEGDVPEYIKAKMEKNIKLETKG